MKRILIFALLTVSILSAYAAGYNSKQEALRTGIENNLKKRGYTVERQSDGLKFINEGDTYYVEIDETDTNPMYVRLVRYIKFDDDLKREDVMQHLTEYNCKYAVKALCKEKNLILTGEMFVTNADQFNYAFGEILSLMKGAYRLVNSN